MQAATAVVGTHAGGVDKPDESGQSGQVEQTVHQLASFLHIGHFFQLIWPFCANDLFSLFKLVDQVMRFFKIIFVYLESFSCNYFTKYKLN